MTVARSGGGSVQRTPQGGLAEVLDLVLDKGLVIDAFIKVSVVGIEILTIDARSWWPVSVPNTPGPRRTGLERAADGSPRASERAATSRFAASDTICDAREAFPGLRIAK